MTPTVAALVSLLGGVAVLALKWVAYQLTDSVALYSDALETLVNVAAAASMLAAIRIALRPADADHPYGHSKVEYFAVAFEGLLIAAAAIAIGLEVWARLDSARPVTAVGWGAAIAAVAALANGLLATMLIRVGRATASPALVADGRHLWTDVVTTVGALSGALMAQLTGLLWLDPLVALVVAAHILQVGYQLIRDSVAGLMDASLGADELARVVALIETHRGGSLEAHDVRTRRAGQRVFVELHLVVMGSTSVAAAHGICDHIERGIQGAFPAAHVTIHVEPEEELSAPAEAGPAPRGPASTR